MHAEVKKSYKQSSLTRWAEPDLESPEHTPLCCLEKHWHGGGAEGRETLTVNGSVVKETAKTKVNSYPSCYNAVK